MEENPIVEIKIIRVGYDSLVGVQKTEFDKFHEYHERYPYLGTYSEGDIVKAKLIYQAKYPGDQWSSMPDAIAENTYRETRRIYIDVR